MTAAVPTLAYWHLATVLPAFVIGSVMLLRRKGTLPHRALGRVFMLLMADSLGILLVYQVFQGWRDKQLILGDSAEIRCLSGAAITIAMVLWLAFSLQASLIYLIIPSACM